MDLSSLVSAAMSWSGGQKYLVFVLGIVAACLLSVFLQEHALLTAEKAAHNATLAKLELSEANCASLIAALDAAHNATVAMQDNIRAALHRESQARADAATRKQIIQGAAVRKRTEQEAKEVIDDAARTAVVDRLNRPL